MCSERVQTVIDMYYDGTVVSGFVGLQTRLLPNLSMWGCGSDIFHANYTIAEKAGHLE
jgi:hypothetical protein